MAGSLRTKLSISYVSVAVLSIVLISLLTNIFVVRHFREYVKQNQQQKNSELVNTLSRQYRSDGEWDIKMLENIGVSALENGTIIKVQDIDGNIIWDATQHNNGMCQRIIEQMAHNAGSSMGVETGNYKEIPYGIYNDSQKVGEVQIGSYGPYNLNNHDIDFINTLNSVLFWVGIFSLVLALILGTLMAKRISSPISRVIAAAKSISNGFFTGRISEKANTSEINQLTETINHLAETLEKQETLRKRLTGDVAHELRTPVATLQSHMEAMIDGIWQADAERLKSCHEEIVRISKMVGDLEKLAKYEGENLSLNKEIFDITELFRRLIKNFETEFLIKELNIQLYGGEERLYADKDKISQVVVNLLSNALKYTPRNGEVTVTVDSSEETVQFSVKDNGQGIAEEDLPFIFERFYRADKSRNRLTGGAGIGLTISKAIVTAHSGCIDIKSRVGMGTEFIVTLPKRMGKS